MRLKSKYNMKLNKVIHWKTLEYPHSITLTITFKLVLLPYSHRLKVTAEVSHSEIKLETVLLYLLVRI